MTDQSEFDSTTDDGEERLGLGDIQDDIVERMRQLQGGNDDGSGGTLNIMERYRALPTDLGMAGQVIDPPSQMDDVAMEVLRRLARRGWDLIQWRGETRVRHEGTNGAYVPLGQGDEHEAIASSMQIAFGGALRQAPNGDVLPWGTQPATIDGVVRSVIRRARVNDRIEHNTWVDEQDLRQAQSWLDERYPGVGLGDRLDTATSDQLIQCRSGILWCPEDGRGRPMGRVLLPRSRGLFSTISVAADYDPGAGDGWGGGGEPGRWLSFLEELWPGDAEQRETLRRWFGYVISGRTDLQKMLIVVGPPRSGKGVIAHVLTGLLGGLTRIDSTTFQRLNEPFGLANAVGKPLMLIPDARVTSGTKMITQRLLSISGEDPVAVNRKHKPELVTKLDARIMIMSNEMPSLRDASQALAERMVPLRMEESFVGREDPHLKNRLDDELGGILHWALDGMDALRSSTGADAFLMGEASKHELDEIREDMAPAAAFIKETCALDPEGWTASNTLYDMWCAWAVEAGVSVSLDRRVFGRELAASGLKIVQRKRGGVRGWAGVRPSFTSN